MIDYRDARSSTQGSGGSAQEWRLRGADEGGSPFRANLWPLPFRVGRRPGVHLRLTSKRVSQEHAELYLDNGSLWVRDLSSTNGTFVNGERVTEVMLRGGDVLHFADQQFVLEGVESQSLGMETLRFQQTELGPMPQIQRTRQLLDLLGRRAVRVEFQPLVHLEDGRVMAYEALGRGDLEGAPCSPGQLFAVAEQLGLAAELSALFREHQLWEATRLPVGIDQRRPAVFVNTHPAEMGAWEGVLESLRLFRESEPDLVVVLEIHESAVTDIETFRRLRQRLDEMDVLQAFDDFGTGQARLEELCEVSPDFVKFDINFARDLHRASDKRREMIRMLVRMMVDMKIATVIEGVENAEEAAACRDLGFDYAQGYHFGRPAPLSELFVDRLRGG